MLKVLPIPTPFLHGTERQTYCNYPQQDTADTQQLVVSQSLLYHFSIALIKTSLTLQYLHLFSLIRPIIICCYILLFCILCGTAWGIFGVIFLCPPISAYWDVKASGTCMNAETHFFSTAVVGIVLDWAIWILPIPVVGQLKLPQKQKRGLMGMFGLGVVVCVVSVLRLVLVWHYAHRGEVTSTLHPTHSLHMTNIQYLLILLIIESGTFALMWSTIELNVAIICASLLVMKPLFARLTPCLVPEQPVSAREDARIWRALTGLSQLVDTERGQGRIKECKRRDTAMSMRSKEGRGMLRPERAWDPQRGLKVKRRSWLL
jgi:hypothetical protein